MCDCPYIPGNYCCFKNPYTPVTHVIFDLDGTLLDTEEIDKQIFTDICKEYGKKYTQEIHELVLGTNENTTCKTIIKALQLDVELEEFQRKFKEKNYKIVPNAYYMCGVEKVVNHLYEQQIPIAIATSSTAEAIAAKVSKKKEFFDKFHHIVSGNSDPEVLRGKPYPNIYFVAARRFDERPLRKHCLVFEDAFNGVIAAKGAGMQVIMCPTMETPYEKWKYATLRLDNMDWFFPELFGLPAFGSPIPPKKKEVERIRCKAPDPNDLGDICADFDENAVDERAVDKVAVEEIEDPCKDFEEQNQANVKVTNY